jgi:hypothetical protein
MSGTVAAPTDNGFLGNTENLLYGYLNGRTQLDLQSRYQANETYTPPQTNAPVSGVSTAGIAGIGSGTLLILLAVVGAVLLIKR